MTVNYYCPRCTKATEHFAAGQGDLRCRSCGLLHEPILKCEHDWDFDASGVVSCVICRRTP